MHTKAFIYAIITVMAPAITWSFAMKTNKYQEIDPGIIVTPDWRCQRLTDTRKYGWINCAVWCQQNKCEVFNFSGDECTICSRSIDFFINQPEQPAFNTMYGKLVTIL